MDSFNEWRWAVLVHLDWYGLRPFITGTAAAPADNATDEEKLAYQRNKIAAYCAIYGSLQPEVKVVIEHSDYFMGCLYDGEYDAQFLWDGINEIIPAYLRQVCGLSEQASGTVTG
jgi:hypothetical protein